MDKLSVPAYSMQPGDVVGSGEVVASVQRGLHTPAGKVEVVLRRGASTRSALWNSRTIIHIKRPAPQYEVNYRDASGPHSVPGSQTEARAVFSAQVQRAAAGEVEFVLLADPHGNVIDEWGT